MSYSRSAFCIKNHLHGPLQRQQRSPRFLIIIISARCANSDAVPDKNVKFPVPFRNRSKIHRATDRHLLNVDVFINVDVILRF